MTPEILMGIAAGLLAAGAAVLVVLFLILRKGARSSPIARTAKELSELVRQLERLLVRLEAYRENGQTEAEPATEQTDGPTPAPAQDAEKAAPAAGSRPAPPAGLESLSDAVVKLDRQGLDSMDISRRLGVPVGEVDLVLKLRRSGTVPDR